MAGSSESHSQAVIRNMATDAQLHHQQGYIFIQTMEALLGIQFSAFPNKPSQANRDSALLRKVVQIMVTLHQWWNPNEHASNGIIRAWLHVGENDILGEFETVYQLQQPTVLKKLYAAGLTNYSIPTFTPKAGGPKVNLSKPPQLNDTFQLDGNQEAMFLVHDEEIGHAFIGLIIVATSGSWGTEPLPFNNLKN
ncbi:hypothetical protein CCACVL1_19792 [Corchorus capsularis]|uniref:Uncharacterized protein n=1 Tax=Corchorus capsularis TaxID=210143 RepID=A0A1R3HES1_COCAP|nr:hypothetical protein CCACVL1_19792 [Corchorus capsularis]